MKNPQVGDLFRFKAEHEGKLVSDLVTTITPNMLMWAAKAGEEWKLSAIEYGVVFLCRETTDTIRYSFRKISLDGFNELFEAIPPPPKVKTTAELREGDEVWTPKSGGPTIVVSEVRPMFVQDLPGTWSAEILAGYQVIGRLTHTGTHYTGLHEVDTCWSPYTGPE